MKLFQLTLILFVISLLSNPNFSRATGQIVRLEGDRLTLDVENQQLSTILGKLSDQGIRILIDPRINPRISATFDSRPVGSAMNSILKSVDYAFIWKEDKASEFDEPRLWEIRIFYKGQGERIRLLKKSKPRVVVSMGDGVYHMKDTLLVKLAATMTEADLAALLEQLDATIVDRHSSLGLIRLRLPHGSDVPAMVKMITGYPGIATADPDYAYPLERGRPVFMDSSPPLPASSPSSSTGSTLVAVMDSGLLEDYESNPYVQGAFDAVSPGAPVNDLLGHGTQMALIAAGVVNPLGVEKETAATSSVVAIRVIGDGGFTSDYTLIRGIDYAIQEEARVISLSWGSENASPMLKTAIDYAAEKGLILVAAAGNVPTGKPVYPAAYENVIGVGALTPDGEHWEQSNYGDFVAVYAPGLAELPVGYQGDPGTYAGTSIATAYTAHLVASILDKMPDADMETILLNLATGHR